MYFLGGNWVLTRYLIALHCCTDKAVCVMRTLTRGESLILINWYVQTASLQFKQNQDWSKACGQI